MVGWPEKFFSTNRLLTARRRNPEKWGVARVRLSAANRETGRSTANQIAPNGSLWNDLSLADVFIGLTRYLSSNWQACLRQRLVDLTFPLLKLFPRCL